MAIPKYNEMFNLLLQSIKEFGGEATVTQLEDDMSQKLHLTEKEKNELHSQNSKFRTELQYQLAWARTYLKAYGLIDNDKRGHWLLTTKGREIESVDSREVALFVMYNSRARKKNNQENSQNSTDTSVSQ